MAYYKRQYFGIKAEHLPVEQGRLFEETLAADMAAITEELAQFSETKPKGQAKRKPLPSEPRPTPPKVCVWQYEFRRQLS